MIFFTSDTHFGHRLLIPDYRKFQTTDEMDEAIIHNWNSVVGERDTVYHLGDVAVCGSERTLQLMHRLNGHKILIRGNHDQRSPTYYERAGFSGVIERAYIEFDGDSRLMIHDPTEAYSHYGGIIHGHIHVPHTQSPISWTPTFNELRINVNVELWNYTPVSAAQISTLLRKYAPR